MTEMRKVNDAVFWHWREEQVKEMIRKSKHVNKIRNSLKMSKRTFKQKKPNNW